MQYLVEHKLQHACAPLPTIDGTKSLYIKEGDLIVVVFEWAQGDLVNFFDLKWMSDIPLITAWGRYFAGLHKTSQQFIKDHP